MIFMILLWNSMIFMIFMIIVWSSTNFMIFLILLWNYCTFMIFMILICNCKIFMIFIILLRNYMCLMISMNVTVHVFYIWFCTCFVKMHLTVVGGCRMFVFCFMLQCFFMISGSWKGQPEAYSEFYICFMYVSCKLMWEFVGRANARILFILWTVFNDFGERHNSWIL